MDASVIAMDKVLAKQIAFSNDIPVSKFVFLTNEDVTTNLESEVQRITEELKFPLFVKPAHLGSSIGISKVVNDEELANALEVAAYYDEKIIVEEGVENLIEVTIPMMGNDVVTAALIERPLTQSDDFFDFDTKYINGGGKKSGGKQSGASGAQGYSELPAKLRDDLSVRALEVAAAVYKAIGATGMARVDLLIDSKTDTVYFNEVNPLPGSLYSHNWRLAGVSPMQLVEKFIVLAEERFEAKQKLNSTFTSNFLEQF